MNEKTNSWKNTVIAVIVIAIVAVAGYLYANRNQGEEELLTGLPVSEATTVEGDLLRTLGKLKKLQLSENIFSDPVWLNLQDFGQTIAPEPKGRQNPFAPLSKTESKP